MIYATTEVMDGYSAEFMLYGRSTEEEAKNELTKDFSEKIAAKKEAWLEEYKGASEFAKKYFMDFNNFKNSEEAKNVIASELQTDHTEQDEDACLTEYWNANY